MNTRLTTLLMLALTGLMIVGQADASPRYLDGDWIAARDDREYGRQEEREARRAKRQEERKQADKPRDDEREHGFGYGYERRTVRPQQPDDRGRR